MSVDSLGELATIPDPLGSGAKRALPPISVPTEPSPTRGERSRLRTILLVAAATWAIAIPLVLGLRPDLTTADAIVRGAGLVALLAIAAFLLRVTPTHGLGPAAPALRAAIVGIPAFYLVLTLLQGSGEPSTIGVDVACGLVSFAIALGPLGVAVVLFRRGFLTTPALRGGATGLLCGLVASATLHLHCPSQNHIHLLLAHGLVLVFAALIGSILGIFGGRA